MYESVYYVDNLSVFYWIKKQLLITSHWKIWISGSKSYDTQVMGGGRNKIMILEDRISCIFLNVLGGCWFTTFIKGSRHT